MPRLIHQIYSFFVSDSGKLTVEGANFLCQLNCGGSGTGPGTGELTAPTIQATDGVYLDKIRISWPVVAGAIGYDIYRNLTDDSAGAGMIGTTTTTTFDDTAAAQGQVYFYWVKARNLTAFSAFSNSDSGFAAVALAAIADLGATQGYGGTVQVSALETRGIISVVWTPPAGAERYDIFRNSENTFGTATKIATDRVPYDNSLSLSTGPQPTFLDNGGEVVFTDTSVPTRFDKWYYWVVAKSGTGASISPESNSAVGWAVGDGSGAAPLSNPVILSGETAIDVPANVVRAFIVLIGSGAGGAGSGATYGGGGGGGPAVVQGGYATMAGGKVKVVSAPEAYTGRANTQTNGANASVTTFQYAPDGVTYATLMTVQAAARGLYAAAGGGLGGAGSTGSFAGGVTDGVVRGGRAGGNAMGSKGGRSGYYFGTGRFPPAHFQTFDPGGYLGDGAVGGNPAASGSMAHPAGGILTYGGEGKTGWAAVYFYTA